MDEQKPSQLSPLIDLWLPEATLEERIAAQRTVDELADCFRRICERLVREEQEPMRDKSHEYVSLGTPDSKA